MTHYEEPEKSIVGINNAYDSFMEATERAYNIGEALIEAETELDKRKAKALVSGEIDGKNEGARAAQAIEMFPQHYADVDRLNRLSREAKLRLDLTRIHVERVRALLRLAELTQPT